VRPRLRFSSLWDFGPSHYLLRIGHSNARCRDEDTSSRHLGHNTYHVSRIEGDAMVERIGRKLRLLEIVFESAEESKTALVHFT